MARFVTIWTPALSRLAGSCAANGEPHDSVITRMTAHVLPSVGTSFVRLRDATTPFKRSPSFCMPQE